MTARVLPAYGHELVKTPHLDKIAEGGVVFENAYCSFPLCAPSRFSMLSGQLPSRIGAYDNAAEFTASTPTIAHYLRALGYYTCLAGKMHFIGPDQLHGYEDRLTTDIYPADFLWTPDWSTGRPESPGRLGMQSVVDAGLCRRNMQIDYDEEVCAASIRKIYDLARATDDRPFFFTVSFTHPHNPYITTQRYWDLYPHDKVDLPLQRSVPVEQQDPHSRRLHELYRTAEYRVTEEQVRAARHAYYGMVSYVDDQVGTLLAALEDTGLADNTVVVFTADHGEMLGERGMWYKMTLLDWVMRVPMLMRVPGVGGGRRTAQVVSSMDLLPTILDIATDGRPSEPAERLDGRSLCPLLTADDPAWADEALAEYTAEGALSPCVMLRQGRYKMIYSEPDGVQLYDIDRDPEEMENLAGNTAYADTERRMLADIHCRWKLADLDEAVRASQRRRLLVRNALGSGRHTTWDYQPGTDASRQYVRSDGATLVKIRSRFPYVEPTPAMAADAKAAGAPVASS